jgi:hypothetical protein
LGFIHPGSFFIGDFNLLCAFSWGFSKDYLGLGSDLVMVYFVISRLWGCGLVVKHLASFLKMLGATPFYTQGEEVYLLKLTQLINCSPDSK